MTFDAVVAQRFARMVENHPAHLPLLVQYVLTNVDTHPEALVEIAQQGEGAMAAALDSALQSIDSHGLLRRLERSLPARTVQLRDFAIAVLAKLLSTPTPTTDPQPLGDFQLTVILAGRLRESGRPAEALALLQKLDRHRPTANPDPLLESMYFQNLGATYADLGRDAESLTANMSAATALRRYPDQNSSDWARRLVGCLCNVAAAATRLGSFPEAKQALQEAEQYTSAAIHDKGLLLRHRTLQMTTYAEMGELETSRALGVEVCEWALDLEEGDRQAYLPPAVDALMNLGFIYMDLHRPTDARQYLETALQFAAAIIQQSATPQSQIKHLVVRIALHEAKTASTDPIDPQDTADLAQESKRLHDQHPSAYAEEVHCRALQTCLKAQTHHSPTPPDPQLIDEMLLSSAKLFDPNHPDLCNHRIRALYVASHAYQRLAQGQRALECIQEATRIAESSLNPEKITDLANLAALQDALSRRHRYLAQMEEALTCQERALTLIMRCCDQQPDTYRDWFQQMVDWYGDLCNEYGQLERLRQFFAERGLEVDIEAFRR